MEFGYCEGGEDSDSEDGRGITGEMGIGYWKVWRGDSRYGSVAEGSKNGRGEIRYFVQGCVGNVVKVEVSRYYRETVE